MSFDKFNFNDSINKALDQKGYKLPTPIQEKAIPLVLEGKDLIGCAQTGTGKTAAFALPVIQLLSLDRTPRKIRRNIRALVLAPTRELAVQISESFRIYAGDSGIRNTVVYGGVSQRPQTEKLRKGVDVIIATPGRLLDLMEQKFIDLKHVSMLILDEADRMLDMGFIHDIRKIISSVPRDRQTLFFSATMPPEITKLASDILKDPVKIEIESETPAVEAISQQLFYVARNDKKKLLLHLLQDKNISSALVFTRTKNGAEQVVRHLSASSINAESIHSDKSQSARQRALSNFKSRSTRVLVATDIASRGIDVQKISHVINYDVPEESETYVHRIGRTGRAGLEGIAMTFCDDQERMLVKDIHRLIKIPIPVIQDHPFADRSSKIKDLKHDGSRKENFSGFRKKRNDNRRGQKKQFHKKGNA